VRTIVLSDLHLGSRTDADVLRLPEARAALEEALRSEPPDRLVLLGDLLELRHGPVADALDAARPALEVLGDAVGPGGRVVLVPGNHDHALVAHWHDRRSLRREPPLTLSERVERHGSDALSAIASALAPARLEVAYPGLWLRDDVYATHGHYLDRHFTVPTFERLAAGAMERVVGPIPAAGATPADYEAALAPIYAWLHAIARGRTGFGASRQRGSQHMWQVLTAKGPRPVRRRALAAAFPLAVRLLNRAGVGPVRAELSGPELRRAGLAAMGEALRRLGVDATWVVFGHTHRPGPLDGDDPAEWRPGGGPALVNSGSWVYEEVFAGRDGPGNPYWPGTLVVVGEDGPPRVRNALAGWRPAL